MHYVCDVKVSKIAGANEKRDRCMFCADIFCGKYIGQTGCESLILIIRQAGELEVAKKYNYQPNNAAVSLVNKKSKLIGIVFNEMMERWSVICFGTWVREISVP